MHNILLIGDSLTEYGNHLEYGWSNKMKELYKDKALVHNRGYPSYTSQMIRDIFPAIMGNITCPLFCTILLGTNDCYSKKHVTPDKYKENIIYMIHALRKYNHQCLILLITPPVAAFNNQIVAYVNKVYEIMNENDFVEYIDLHSGPNQIIHSDLYDGVHFNIHGETKVFESVKNILYSKYPFLCPEQV
jgi:lysophospholipase L1-like esterase